MELVKYDNEQKKRLRENLKKFTEEQGLAKTDLADKLGYAYNTVISWFNGSRVHVYRVNSELKLFVIFLR